MKFIRVIMKPRIGFSSCLRGLSFPSLLCMILCLPMIIIDTFFLLKSFLRDVIENPQFAIGYYPPRFEYIMLSLALLIGGVLLIDYAVKSIQ